MVRKSTNLNQKIFFQPLPKGFINMSQELILLSDKRLYESWIPSPYTQYICRMTHFEHKFLCDLSDFVHFRKRIGEKGVLKIGSMTASKTLIVTTIKSFKGNPYGSTTTAPLPEQMKSNSIYTIEEVVYDHGGKGLNK